MPLGLEFLQHFAIALLLGGLVGLERERAHEMEGLHEFGGIRTISLISLFAFLAWTFFGDTILFTVLTAGLMILLVASYVTTAVIQKTTGGTSEIAALFSYLIGVLVGMGEVVVAAAVTLVLVGILYFKETIHTFAHRVGRDELYETLKFVGVVLVLGPLLPNQAMGPWGVWNPYSIWLMMILISSISFVSYIGVKLLGFKRGFGLVGFLGGLTSSTAVSISFASISKSIQKGRGVLAMGVVLASSAMFFRVLLEIALVNIDLARHLLVDLGLMGFVGLVIAFFLYIYPSKKRETALSVQHLPLASPFQINRAFQFAVFFAALLLAARFLQEHFGDRGLMAAAAISGIIDVDAISLSMASWSLMDQVKMELAERAVFVALIVNTVSKGVIVLLFGHPQLALRVIAAFSVLIAVGLFNFWLF